MRQDLTNLIERIDAFEDRLGVEFQGLYAYQDDPEFVNVFGELHSLRNPKLNATIEIVMTCHDISGRVLDRTVSWMNHETFFGFEGFQIVCGLAPGAAAGLTKIKIYPKLM